ncbi:MAG: hypothetical protein OMM_02128 [Candidatus Magnetoglobus multicellularis str. Araruama]|uniref:GTP cyclohydrolase II n=1 Tax=Candidatus Magnetoglobus multicellularis str. Araruama TaxID=890399 RepID=A0A1V1PAW1_9BACT|nr:MAG: hypothetical protein OMM_02128 [Candidatus Magnetoglobus multicellularis str. Araruama]
MSDNIFTNWCYLPTSLGKFRMYDTGNENLRLICSGNIKHLKKPPLIRVHSSCIASEVFKSLDCDCSDQLWMAMKMIHSEGSGLIFHLNQEGRGQGLSNKIKAINLMQHKGLDTHDAFNALGLEQDIRSYQSVVDILLFLNIHQIKLITNNPQKISFFNDKNICVKSVVSTIPIIRVENQSYLISKKNKLNHKFDLSQLENQNSYPDTLKKKETAREIKFYEKDQPYGFFSNFSNHAVYLKNKIWKTSEHYYQSQKYANSDYEEKIRLAPSPMIAAKMGRDHRFSPKPDWENVKNTIMLEVLFAKFTQHPELKDELIKTAPLTIIEHTENDHYWGDGGNGSGKNMLGKLLMKVRSSLLCN